MITENYFFSDFLTVDALKIKEMPVKQSLVSGQSVSVDVKFRIVLWFYPGQVILQFQHMTTHTANLQLLPHTPKLTPASVMWDVIWKHGFTLCEHTVYLKVLGSVFKFEGSAPPPVLCFLISHLFSNFEALLWLPCLLLENLVEEQQCREMLATHFWVCRVGKGVFSKLTLCPCKTSAIQFVYKDVALTSSKNALERDELAFIITLLAEMLQESESRYRLNCYWYNLLKSLKMGIDGENAPCSFSKS